MNARRLILGPLAVLCALTALTVVSVAPALAARGHVFERAFGQTGSGNGEFSEPDGVAVNESSGDVYVVDKGNDRVEWFSSAGVYMGEFNGSGTNAIVEVKPAPTGRFSSPESIAVDNDAGSPSFGDVYVADVGHEAIDKFSSSGEYIGQLTETSAGSTFEEIQGIAVDAGGLLWVYQGSKKIDDFSDAVANEFLSSREANVFGGANPGFAVDSSDNLYVKTIFAGISKLNEAGEVLIEGFDSLITKFGSSEVPSSVAVDLSSNEVYIDDADNEGSVGRFSSSGSFIEKFGSEHLTKGSGIAVNSTTDEVYVADADADKLDVFVLEPESRPLVEEESQFEITDSSAKLTARIKPRGPAATYYFQYGTASCSSSPSACTDLPAPPGAEVGNGFEATSVSIRLQGLIPETTYKYRVVAVNELGSETGPERTFTTQTASTDFALPDGRSWELVTPPNKQGSGLIAVGNEQGAAIQAAENGDGIAYGATSPITANPEGSRSLEVTQAISTRTAPGGWETQDIATPHNEGPTGIAIGHSAEYKLFSASLSAGLVEPVGDTPLPPLPAGAEKTIYLRKADGSYEALVTAENVPAGTKFGGDGESAGGVSFVTATPDFSHVILHSDEGVKLSSASGDNGGGLYEWAGGRLLPVSVLPNGNFTVAELGDHGYGDSGNVRHALSDDGSRLIFGAEGHLYLRDMSSKETVQIDAAQEAPEPANPEGRYETANSEGSRVFFTSGAQLTASPSGPQGARDLYVFEATGESGPLTGKLIDLTADHNGGEGAEVLGVMGASEDGTSVYFVANGALAAGSKKGNCERRQEPFHETCNVYLERYDEATEAWAAPVLVATISGADRPSWGGGTSDLNELTSRISPNGRYLAFMSERSLTGYDNRDAGSGVRDEEVFLYDASSKRLVCASCDTTGARPTGIHEGSAYQERIVDYARNWSERWLAANIPGWTSENLAAAQYQSRYLSDSGRLFFNSSDALVPGDVDGTQDVYEYEPQDFGSCRSGLQSAGDVYDEATGGCVALISAGTSAEESAFLDASETGSDVFFLTSSRLSSQDYDTSYDIYDAHECSASSPCAPAPAQPAPPCDTGDSCKPAPSPQPAIFGAPSSATFTGSGDLSLSPAAPKVIPRGLTRAQKLARALKRCQSKPRRGRAACKARARRTYAAMRSKARRSRVARSLAETRSGAMRNGGGR
jgi:DNA-binding beta-propeller fold protein YncE